MHAGPGMFDMASLSGFQRMLLGADGSVTHILEVYAGEPIEVVKLLQEPGVCDTRDVELVLPAGDPVIRRQVLLRGSRSKENLLQAEAVVAVDRVALAFLEGLAATEEPIGALLAEDRTETFREILRVDREPAGSAGVHFGVDNADHLIFRVYRILAGGQPIIVIKERFPPSLFRDGPA